MTQHGHKRNAVRAQRYSSTHSQSRHYEEPTGHYPEGWVGPTVGLHVFAPDGIRSSDSPASAA